MFWVLFGVIGYFGIFEGLCCFGCIWAALVFPGYFGFWVFGLILDSFGYGGLWLFYAVLVGFVNLVCLSWLRGLDVCVVGVMWFCCLVFWVCA